MASYNIKKTSNGEYKEIEKQFKLNVLKYAGDPKTLYFSVEGQSIPFLMDYNLFFTLMHEQIQNGLMESLDYKDGTIKAVSRDGNTIRNYTYDFNWEEMDKCPYRNDFDILKRSVYKIVSLYTENPNSALTTDQKYKWLIYGILDGDRIPIIENKDELLRIFQVYNANKDQFLETLLNNVVFYDSDNRIIEYSPKLKIKMLRSIKYDVFNQMELAMLIFVSQNHANELYQDYLNNLHIPRKEITYVDEEGNEIETTSEMQSGTILSLGLNIFEKGLTKIKSTSEHILTRRKNKKDSSN